MTCNDDHMVIVGWLVTTIDQMVIVYDMSRLSSGCCWVTSHDYHSGIVG